MNVEINDFCKDERHYFAVNNVDRYRLPKFCLCGKMESPLKLRLAAYLSQSVNGLPVSQEGPTQ